MDVCDDVGQEFAVAVAVRQDVVDALVVPFLDGVVAFHEF